MVATARLGLNLQPVGSNVNTWGQILNDEAIGLLDEAVAGVETIAVTASFSLTSTNFVTNQARNPVLVLTAGGGLVAAPTVTVPAKEKVWLVVNQTGFAVTFTCGGATVALPIGRTGFIICNGTNLLKLDPVTDALAGSSASATTAAASAAAAAASAAQAATSEGNANSAAASSAGFASASAGYRDQSMGYRDQSQGYANAAAASAASLDAAKIPVISHILNLHLGS